MNRHGFFLISLFLACVLVFRFFGSVHVCRGGAAKTSVLPPRAVELKDAIGGHIPRGTRQASQEAEQQHLGVSSGQGYQVHGPRGRPHDSPVVQLWELGGGAGLPLGNGSLDFNCSGTQGGFPLNPQQVLSFCRGVNSNQVWFGIFRGLRLEGSLETTIWGSLGETPCMKKKPSNIHKGKAS